MRLIRTWMVGRSSRLRALAGTFAVLTLVAGGQVLVLAAPASAQPSTPQILVPSNGAAVSGTEVVLDASVTGATTVTFHLLDTGGNVVADLGNATLSYYGWIAEWNSVLSGVANGSYLLIASADDATGAQSLSQPLDITVDNVGPTNVGPSMLLPSNNATVGASVLLDATTANTTPGFSSVQFMLDGGQAIGNATLSYYGWIGLWNNISSCSSFCYVGSNSVPDGIHTLQANAIYPGGITVAGPAITVTLVNPAIVVPPQGGTIAQGSTVTFDAVAPGASSVAFFAANGPTAIPWVISSATPSLYGWVSSVTAGGTNYAGEASFPIQSATSPTVIYMAAARYPEQVLLFSVPLDVNISP